MEIFQKTTKRFLIPFKKKRKKKSLALESRNKRSNESWMPIYNQTHPHKSLEISQKRNVSKRIKKKKGKNSLTHLKQYRQRNDPSPRYHLGSRQFSMITIRNDSVSPRKKHNDPLSRLAKIPFRREGGLIAL